MFVLLVQSPVGVDSADDYLGEECFSHDSSKICYTREIFNINEKE
jgi:hypothetical protein